MKPHLSLFVLGLLALSNAAFAQAHAGMTAKPAATIDLLQSDADIQPAQSGRKGG